MITDEQFVELVRNTSLPRVQLAEKLGVALSTIRRWRVGQKLPPDNGSRDYIAERLRAYAKARP